ncbi:MAG: hypothetical protein OXH77_05655 [Anaerolineaceae bacterium]|nr:hypothetical protein [Anaerolineaceae bacterium]
MAATPPPAQVADGKIIAPFADMSIDEYLALVAANPDSHFEFNAAGDVVTMTPMPDHANTRR